MLRLSHARCLRQVSLGGLQAAYFSSATAKGTATREPSEVREERRKFLLDTVVPKLGISDMGAQEEWKRLDSSGLMAMGGRSLLAAYNGSILALLKDLVPEVEWEERRCRRKMSQGYWSEAGNRRMFLDEVAGQCGVKHARDWRKVTTRTLRECGGTGLLAKYSNSLYDLLADTYPEEKLTELDVCKRLPNGFWDDETNRRVFFDRLREEHGVREAGDWKRVDAGKVREMGGGSLLTRYGSLFAALQATYPEMALTEHECCASVPRGFWDVQENRRAFFDRIAEEKNIRALRDWASLTVEDIRERGGGGLLAKFSCNVTELLQDSYPELFNGAESMWEKSMCRQKVSSTYWTDAKNVRSFLEHAQSRLAISGDEDWARVSVRQIIDVNGGGLLRQMTLLEALRMAYPGKRWEEEAFLSRGKRRANQRQMLLALDGIFHDAVGSGLAPSSL